MQPRAAYVGIDGFESGALPSPPVKKDPSMAEEYLTVHEMSQRTKLAEQTLYNLIHQKRFILGKHYLKPSRRKILFIWSEILAWMKNGVDTASVENHEVIHRQAPENQSVTAKSLINI